MKPQYEKVFGVDMVENAKKDIKTIGEWSMEMIYSDDKPAADAGKIINAKAHQAWKTLDRLENTLRALAKA